jgi:polyhydroxybutyrate depolymerase
MKRWAAALLLSSVGCGGAAAPAETSAPAQAERPPAAAPDSPTVAETPAQEQAQTSTAGQAAAPPAKEPAPTAGAAGSAEPRVQPQVVDAAAPLVDEPAPAADAGLADAGSAPSDAGQPTAVECPADALSPGDSTATLMHAGVSRQFLIHVPSGYDNQKATPLVLNFHGASSNAQQQRSLFSLMDATSDAKGFVVVYPQGVGDSWNAGACCGDAMSQEVDDVGFARALVEYMTEHVCVDRKRVYATGFSNGGRMSYRLGCEAADMFAAIAPVAGTKSFPDLDNTPGCMPSRPLSVIDFMGSADMRIEAQPGQIKEWAAFDGCTDAQPAESYRMGAHFCMAYTKCNAGTSVTYCVIDGGGHCWPGSTPCPLGATSRADELSANELMWELFERSTL